MTTEDTYVDNYWENEAMYLRELITRRCWGCSRNIPRALRRNGWHGYAHKLNPKFWAEFVGEKAVMSNQAYKLQFPGGISISCSLTDEEYKAVSR